MLHAVVTALLLVVVLLIIFSILFGAWRAHQRYKRTVATEARLPAHPFDRHVTAILHVHDGNIVSVEEPELQPSFTLPASWYRRHRALVSVGFLVMVLLAFFLQSGLAGGTLQNITQNLQSTILTYTKPVDVHTQSHALPQTASVRLLRIDSAARNQYYSDYQWQVWAYSSCSGIAMAMVMNSYGRHLIAADVLQEEENLGVWNVQLGLLREEGISMTAAYYGFDTSASHSRTVQDVVASANKGAPVIVSVRDSYYYPNGHIFVVRGGNSQYVYIADSSTANFQRMTYPMFQGMWQGFSAILTPRP